MNQSELETKTRKRCQTRESMQLVPRAGKYMHMYAPGSKRGKTRATQ